MPSCKSASANGQLKFITSIRIASAGSPRLHPSRRGRSHDRNPADARRREESAPAVRSQAGGRWFLRSAARWPVKWRCPPNIVASDEWRVARDSLTHGAFPCVHGLCFAVCVRALAKTVQGGPPNLGVNERS